MKNVDQLSSGGRPTDAYNKTIIATVVFGPVFGLFGLAVASAIVKDGNLQEVFDTVGLGLFFCHIFGAIPAAVCGVIFAEYRRRYLRLPISLPCELLIPFTLFNLVGIFFSIYDFEMRLIVSSFTSIFSIFGSWLFEKLIWRAVLS